MNSKILTASIAYEVRKKTEMILEVHVKMTNQFDAKHPIFYSRLFYDRESAMLEVLDWCLHDRRTAIEVLEISMKEITEEKMK